MTYTCIWVRSYNVFDSVLGFRLQEILHWVKLCKGWKEERHLIPEPKINEFSGFPYLNFRRFRV